MSRFSDFQARLLVLFFIQISVRVFTGFESSLRFLKRCDLGPDFAHGLFDVLSYIIGHFMHTIDCEPGVMVFATQLSEAFHAPVVWNLLQPPLEALLVRPKVTGRESMELVTDYDFIKPILLEISLL